MKNHKFRLVVLIVTITSTLTYSQAKLSLEQAKSLAMHSNLQLKNSQLEIDAATKVLEKSRTYYYPQARIDGVLMHAINPLLEINSEGGDLPVYDGNPANIPSSTEFAYFPPSQMGILKNMGVANLSISQPIYTGGKLKIGNKIATIGVKVREEQARMSKNELLLSTEQQYWQIVALQQKQKTIDQFKAMLDRLYIQVKDAFQSGLIIRNDVYKVELELSNLAINQSQLRNARELSLRQFSNTIGIDLDSNLVLLDNLDNYEAPEFYFEIGNEYIMRLSEIEILEKSDEIEGLKVQLKEAEHKPTVAAGTNAFYLTQFENKSGAVNALGFLTLNIPINHLWSGKQDVQEQKIRSQIVRNTLADTKNSLEIRSATAWTQLKETYEQIQIMEQRIIQADENLRVNQNSYQSGVSPLSDLLEAKALQTEALDNLIEAKSRYRTAIAHYLHYTARNH